jgi:hypothetical protein
VSFALNIFSWQGADYEACWGKVCQAYFRCLKEVLELEKVDEKPRESLAVACQDDASQ